MSTPVSPTAAILVIGNEILSGSTQDANIAYIGKHLSLRGIRVMEVRVVADIPSAIIAAVNALRAAYTYVLTTGGIGPTHDDITADCIAAAFETTIDVRDDARALLQAYYDERGVPLNDARLRMARIPAGAKLIDNPVSAAPGFNIENVFVMAGVPKIMQAMLLHVDTMIQGGPPVLSKTVASNQKEGDVAFELGAIQKEYPAVDIGSYPRDGQKPSLLLILRSTDAAALDAATAEVAAMVQSRGEEPVIT
ncbi:MAG: molybdopterin-binding protein [Bdellovibrionales bacterium]|jgi:molybdenum cofactor synthesis domain-containing protein|nr:molybdopterin-binding protein [Bdellovibrionales bacterium]